jgi:hypothetical protein
MNTHTGSVSVLAANLAQTDRRVLSQAQYSALHIPERQKPRGAAHAKRSESASAFANALSSHAPPTKRATAPVATPAHRLLERADVKSQGLDRRAPRTDLARRIARAMEQHPPRRDAASASISVKTPDGRVQLLVRSQGGVTRVVALCAAPLKERVDRALAQARFALAAGGNHIGTCA